MFSHLKKIIIVKQCCVDDIVDEISYVFTLGTDQVPRCAGARAPPFPIEFDVEENLHGFSPE